MWGKCLLTQDDFSDHKLHLTRDIVSCLLEHQIIPVINENATVATIGSNDNLAVLVANLMGADTVILLTDQEGLYTADPRLNPNAELIPTVSCIR